MEGGVQAKMDLGDGFEISVVSMKDKEKQFGGLYGNASEGTYEVAVFYKNDMTPLAKYDDVIGWQDHVAVTRLMKEVQQNGVAWLTLLKEIRNDYTQITFGRLMKNYEVLKKRKINRHCWKSSPCP